MLNRSTRLAMSTSVLKALPGKFDIKRHSPGILYIYDTNEPLEQMLPLLLLHKIVEPGIQMISVKKQY